MKKFLDTAGLTHYDSQVKKLLAKKQPLLVGTPGQVVGFDADGAAQAVRGPSSPNLLRNWDFRRPVNRNGKGEYVGAGYSVDRWVLSAGDVLEITDKGVALRETNETWQTSIAQKIPCESYMIGKTLTLSYLTVEDIDVWISIADNGAHKLGKMHTYTYTIPEDYDNETISVMFNCSNGLNPYHPIAAKLEFGSYQTLAYRDENGDWIINDPPDYDLQYALCSLYSPSTGEWVGAQHSNLNLLDNTNMRDPINQRGLKRYEHSPSSKGYSIDRYNLYRANMTLESDGLLIETTSNQSAIWQPMLTSDLQGLLVTFSALVRDVVKNISARIGRGISTNAFYTLANSEEVIDSEGTTLLSVTYLINNPDPLTHFGVWTGAGASFKLLGLKLELGPQQTLAHQDADGNWVLNDPPPNRALELAKCQRYFYRQNTSRFRLSACTTNTLFFQIPIPAMRATPALTCHANDDNVQWIRSVSPNTGLLKLAELNVSCGAYNVGDHSILLACVINSHGLSDAQLLVDGYIDFNANL